MVRRSAALRFEELESRLLLKGPADAPPLGPPPNPGPDVIWVDTVAELQSAVSSLQSGQTIVIESGAYNLTQTLYVGLSQPVTNATIRGETDNPSDVVLRGRGMENANFGNVPMGFSFYNAQDVTLANLSIGEVWYHPIDLQGGAGAERINLYHLRIYDGGEQLIKSNPGSNDGVDDVKVEYCTLEYTAGPPVLDHGGGTGYTNGMSVHSGDNWTIRHNLFRNFHTPDSAQNLWNPVILMWNHSTGTLVEGNTFINSDRAIAYGLFDNSGSDHSGGIIRNNFIYVEPGLFSSSRRAGADGQIIVWDSPNTRVYHNTIISNGNTPRSIEFRFNTSGGEARNNLTDAPLGTRDGATFAQSDNYLAASSAMFMDPANADFHLVSNSATQANVIDQAAVLAGSDMDWDGQERPSGADADIGADEWQNAGNSPPVASDDAASTDLNTPATITVLANDSDEDGGTLSVTQVNQPGNGTVVLNGDGTVTYTPSTGWFGADTFTYTLSDGQGGTDTATVTVAVSDNGSVALEDDPWNPGRQALVARGTDGPDLIKFRKAKNGTVVRVEFNGVARGDFAVAGISRLIAFGNASADKLVVKSLSFDAQLDGGAGDDTITAAKGNDVLLGGEGADRLNGAAGRDLIFAGLGADYLEGANDHDLLMAGTTSLDDAELHAVLLEWTSNRSYNDRGQRLRTGTDGLPRLDAATVLNDSDADTLRGLKGTDWFFADLALDSTDKVAGELVN